MRDRQRCCALVPLAVLCSVPYLLSCCCQTKSRLRVINFEAFYLKWQNIRTLQRVKIILMMVPKNNEVGIMQLVPCFFVLHGNLSLYGSTLRSISRYQHIVLRDLILLKQEKREKNLHLQYHKSIMHVINKHINPFIIFFEFNTSISHMQLKQTLFKSCLPFGSPPDKGHTYIFFSYKY